MAKGIVFNALGDIEMPDIYLAQKNKHKLGCLNAVADLKITFFLNDMNTCEFMVPRLFKNRLNNVYDELETKMLILVVGYGWFEINVSVQNQGSYEFKKVIGKALEYELSGCSVYALDINSKDIDYEDYEVVKFFNPLNPQASLLHRVMEQCPGWVIGHVDEGLVNLERSFSADDTDVYSFLTGEVAQAFNCFFIFDSFERSVNAYIIDDYGKNTNIFLSMENLTKTVDVKVEDTQIKTVYRIVGEKGIDVEEVNLNGTDKIYDYSYYLNEKYMSQGTIDAYNAYANACNTYQQEYLLIMLNCASLYDEIINLEQMVPADINSEDWSLYGLTLLETKLTTYENTLNNYINAGYGDISSPYYNTTYLVVYNSIQAIKAAISTRESAITAKQTSLQTIQERRGDIWNELKIENFFTNEQWTELNYHSYVKTYKNDNYILTDLDTDLTRFETTQKLLTAAKEDLAIAARPQYYFFSTMNNLLQRKEFKNFFDEFELGNFIYLEINENYRTKMRLISLTLNFKSLTDIDVEFSDMIDVGGAIKDSQSILAQTSSVAQSFNSAKSKWDTAAEESDYVAKIRKQGLDASLVSISNSINQDVVIDQKGITGREYLPDNKIYADEQYRLTKNLFAFTDDNWQSVKSAFGKVLINGSYYYGLIADALISKIMITDTLTLSNKNSTVSITGNGAEFFNCGITVVRGSSTLRIDASSGISLTNYGMSQFYIDAYGNASFAGLITGGSMNINGNFIVDGYGNLTANNATLNNGSFYGNITGGSIDIGTDFSVDSQGNLTANNATFTNGEFSGDITAGTININNNFKVDATGNLTANKGLFKGSININNNFLVDTNGNLTAKSGTIEGATIKSSRYIYEYINGSWNSAVDINFNYIQISDRNSNNVPTSYLNLTPNSLELWNSSGYARMTSTSLSCSSISCSTLNGSSPVTFSNMPSIPSYTSQLSASMSGSNISFSGATAASVSYVQANFEPKASSDFRLKRNILPLQIPDEVFMSLKPKQYEFKDNDNYKGIYFGFIAQEVSNCFREKGLDPDNYNLLEKAKTRGYLNEGFYISDGIVNRINYNNLIALTIQQVQKLNIKIAELEETINSLHNTEERT